MYEYEIIDRVTGERGFIWGYNFEDACARAGIQFPDMIEVIHYEYID